MHNTKSDLIIGQKSAQMGYTEWALNMAFFKIDVEAKNVLYILPTRMPDATDFSNARFAPALELSPHLRALFTDINNVGHKRAGNANLYVRGSKSKAGLRSVPVQMIILDEVDVMVQENIPLAMERVSGQPEKQILALSTPTIENYGINLLFEGTDKRNFFFPCPACNKLINLEFPRNLEVTSDDPYSTDLERSRLFCHECKATLNHADKPKFLEKGQWVKSRESASVGYYINQLYSCPIKPHEFARKYLKSLTNQADEQEFYNSALGKPHSTEGSRVTDAHLNSCIGSYKSQAQFERNNFVTMGVDVGKWIHVEIDDWYWDSVSTDPNTVAHCKVIAIFKLRHFEELDHLIRIFGVQKCVIDVNPERRKAYEFSTRFPGVVETCEYPLSTNSRNISVHEEDNRIQVDRTAWLDMSLGRFHVKHITLPQDISYEYKEHQKALTRIFYRDRDGNPRARYVKGNVEDHYAHARNYAEIALNRALVLAGNSTSDNPLYGQRS